MNLVALNLESVLQERGLSLPALYTLRGPDDRPVIPPSKVARLLRSLTEDICAVLSEGELTQIIAWYDLDLQQERRLRASIIAEAVKRLLSAHLPRMTALAVGEYILKLLLEEGADAEALREDLGRSGVHLVAPSALPTVDVNAAIADGLEAAAEACELGELWLSLALSTPARDQQEDLFGLAWTALDRAAQMLATAPSVAQHSAAQAEWRQTIEAALATLRATAPMGGPHRS